MTTSRPLGPLPCPARLRKNRITPSFCLAANRNWIPGSIKLVLERTTGGHPQSLRGNWDREVERGATVGRACISIGTGYPAGVRAKVWRGSSAGMLPETAPRTIPSTAAWNASKLDGFCT